MDQYEKQIEEEKVEWILKNHTEKSKKFEN